MLNNELQHEYFMEIFASQLNTDCAGVAAKWNITPSGTSGTFGMSYDPAKLTHLAIAKNYCKPKFQLLVHFLFI